MATDSRHAVRLLRERNLDDAAVFPVRLGERAEFLHLRRAGELAERIADEDRSRDLFAEQVAAMRQDGRDTRPDVVTGWYSRALAERELGRQP